MDPVDFHRAGRQERRRRNRAQRRVNHDRMRVFVATQTFQRQRFIATVTWLAILLLAILLFSGCGNAGTDGTTITGPHRVYERGPVQVSMTASKDPITTAESLTLTLSATVEDGYAVSFPDYPAPPKEPETTEENPADTPPENIYFTLLDTADAAPTLRDDGRIRRERTYTLEPFLAGQYTIPALAIRFGLESDERDSWQDLETEALRITVASVLAPDAQPVLQDIIGPVSVQNPTPWGWYSFWALVVLGAAAYAYYYRFIRVVPGPPPPPPVPPHVRALEALDVIQRDKLVENGRYKEFYIRVCDVLRHYMEEQFGVQAPERTTEEFLQELQHSAHLGLQEQLLLKEFLRHCDLVKFAKAEPTSEEIQSTFNTCKQVVNDTAAAQNKSAAPTTEAS